MPNKDRFHEAVRRALTKDGWKITHDPLFINFAQVEMYVDLGAIRRHQLKLIVYAPDLEVIIQWLP